MIYYLENCLSNLPVQRNSNLVTRNTVYFISIQSKYYIFLNTHCKILILCAHVEWQSYVKDEMNIMAAWKSWPWNLNCSLEYGIGTKSWFETTGNRI